MNNIIKCYCYTEELTKESNKKCITRIDELISSGIWNRDVFEWQTYPNLYEYDEFEPYTKTFIESCEKYSNKKIDDPKLKMWSYVDHQNHYVNLDRDKLWHAHTGDFSGFFYLDIPTDDGDISESGTEFYDGPNIVPEYFCWFICPSHLLHRPGKIKSVKKRYVLAANIYIN